MTKFESLKGINLIIILLSIISSIGILSGCSIPPEKKLIEKPAIDPFMYCCTDSACIDIIQASPMPGKGTYNNVTICKTSIFSSACQNTNGIIVTNDLQPLGGSFYECYPKSSDSNESCGSDDDCMYYCDFETAIKNHKCTDIMQLKKDDKDYGDKIYYITTYLCNNVKKPGTCSQGPLGLSNPSVKVKYYMDGNHLIRDESPSVG